MSSIKLSNIGQIITYDSEEKRMTSKDNSEYFLRALMTGGPIVKLGTK